MLTQIQKTAAFTVLLVLASLVAMLFSYRAAYHMVRSGTGLVLGKEHAQQAQQLRQYRNELVQLASEFLERSKRYPGPGTEDFQKWIAQDFSPRFHEFRRSLLDAQLPAEPMAALLQAAEKLAAALSQPERGDLRVLATDQALEAASVVDGFLQGWASPQ